MFFVIDKSKIFSYAIAICTVVILFVAAAGLNNTNNQNMVTTPTNTVEANILNNTISRDINNLITTNNVTNAMQ